MLNNQFLIDTSIWEYDHFHSIKNISTIRARISRFVKIDGHAKLRFWHSDIPAEFFWGEEIFSYVLRIVNPRSRAREIVEKLPWCAFNPSFRVEHSYRGGCKGSIRLVPWNLRTGHYRSAFSLSRKPMESVDIVQTYVCAAAVKSLPAIACFVYVPRCYGEKRREEITDFTNNTVLLTDLWKIRDKNKSIRMDRNWNNPSRFTSSFITFRRKRHFNDSNCYNINEIF